MKKLISIVSILLASVLSQSVSAEIAVIVHPDNAAEISKSDVSKIFLGKAKKFPGGETAMPVTQEAGVKDEFNDKVLSKSSAQVKAFWSKLVFTGKGTPPKELASDDEVKNMVSKNPNLIGYIDVSAVDDSVKVVLKQ